MAASTNPLDTIEPTNSALVPTDLSRVGAYVDASLSANTRRAHATGFADFRARCDDRNCCSLPTEPETLAVYLADLELTAHGLLVTVRRSKGDQEGRGVRIAIPFGRS